MNNEITWEEALKNARKLCGTDNEDAWYLLEYVSGMRRVEYLLHKDGIIPKSILDKYNESITKRVNHIPLQYITGEQEFMGLPFKLTKDVLIPRQDTEILVEQVLKSCNNKAVLDLCTGSGCIAVSIAKLGAPRCIMAVDISEAALHVALENANRNAVDIQFIKSDMFEQVSGRFDIIVSNPPYIPTETIQTLMPEVRDHEPKLALDGSSDGLKCYRIIASKAKNYLTEQGLIFLEIGCEQGQTVKELLLQAGFTRVEVKKDYAGLDRIVMAATK